MPSVFSPSSKASVELKAYSEKSDYTGESPVTNVRSQALIYRENGSQWWITVTFRGDIYSILNQSIVRSKRERRNEFQSFVRLIDYSLLPLLDDTVTELVLGRQGSELILHASEQATSNPFVQITANLRYYIQEDPSRVIYPLREEFPSFQPINLDELSEQRELADGVFHVLNLNNNTPYILKVVNRPLYQSYDTEVIRKELGNLQIFQNEPNIVRAAGIAVSSNPYMTSSTSTKDHQPLVIMGIVLEYYSGGCLQYRYREPESEYIPKYNDINLIVLNKLYITTFSM